MIIMITLDYNSMIMVKKKYNQLIIRPSTGQVTPD